MSDSSWVQDFSAFQDSRASTGPGGIGLLGAKKGKVPEKPKSRAESIEAELKLLEWHRLANDAALKAALMQTKSLHADLPVVKPKHVADDAKWIKKVIEQEHMKSLEVSKDYVLDYTRRETEAQERQENQIYHHVDTLGKMRERLESKKALKESTNEYREFQKEFSAKKWAIMKGMTLDDLEREKEMRETGGGPETNGPAGVEQGHIKPPSDLTNVLESLNRLATLEKRISSLEHGNEFEKLTIHDRTPVAERTSFEFRKKRAVGDGGVKKLVFTVQPKKTQYGQSSSGAGGGGLAAVRARRGGHDTNGSGNGGTFLTGGDFGGNTGEGQSTAAMSMAQKRQERARQMNDSSTGQKVLRGRLQAKKAREKETQAGQNRHNEAMEELARRKRELGSRAKSKMWAEKVQATRAKATKGASAGIKSNNRHTNQFLNEKKALEARRDKKMKVFNRVNTKIGKSSTNQFGGAGSATAPTGVKRTMVKKNTVTRRTAAGTLPTRRAKTSGVEVPLPKIIAVSGVGGLRAIRGQKKENPLRGPLGR